ncbi:MAG: RNA polymerase sigma-70 factor [Chitinophagaceae bacterium]|nr:RNA polymerase sigma-70 factor [Chitinophagaceae bacterium]
MTKDAAYILFTRLSLREDEEALAGLHHIYFYRLYKLACSIVGDTAVAEEIVNDVFLRIWQRRELLKDVANPELYLLKCTRNRSLEILRSRRASILSAEEDELHDFPVQWELSPEQLLISSEMVRYINKVIDQLAPRCKLIFLLVKESNLKYKEVAELLNISVKTVEAQMSIALKKISLSVPLTFLQH